MVSPDLAKWGQTVSDLRRLSVEAPHRRSRERFLALFMIASKQTNASHWCKEIGRTLDTVLSWVHCYNEQGPDAVHYQRTGGHPPFLARNRPSNLSRQSRQRSRLTTNYQDMAGA